MSPDDLRKILNDPNAGSSVKQAARLKLFAMGEPETVPQPTDFTAIANSVASGVPPEVPNEMPAQLGGAPMAPADFQAQAGGVPMEAPAVDPAVSDQLQPQPGGAPGQGVDLSQVPFDQQMAQFQQGRTEPGAITPPEQFSAPAPSQSGAVLRTGGGGEPPPVDGDDASLSLAPRPPEAPPPPGAPPPGGGLPGMDTGRVRAEMRAGGAALDRASEAGEEQQGHLEEAAMLEHNAAQAQQNIYKEHAEQLRAFQGHRQEDLSDATARLKNFSDAYSAAAAEGTGPSTSLIERETRDAVISTVVMGLGALAQIVTQGNTNPLAAMATGIMDRANNAIRRDLQAKLNRLDSLKTATSLADRQLQSLRANFNDDKAFLDYMVQVQIDRDVVPKLKQAAASKNMAAAAGARTTLAIAENNAHTQRAQVERALVGDAQKNALMRMKLQAEQQAATQDDLRFAPDVGESYKTEVRKEYNNLRGFAKDAARLIELRKEMGLIARAGKLGAWISGNKEKAKEYNSLVRDSFKKTSDMGKALTLTEIKFGEEILGNPFALDTDEDTLRAVLTSKIASDTRNFMTNRSGVQLSSSGRAQLERILRYAGGGGPVARPDPTRAQR